MPPPWPYGHQHHLLLATTAHNNELVGTTLLSLKKFMNVCHEICWFVGLDTFSEGRVSVISLFAYPANNVNANKAVSCAFGLDVHQRRKTLNTTLYTMRLSWLIPMKFFYRNYTTAPQNSLTSKHLLNYVCARARQKFFLCFFYLEWLPHQSVVCSRQKLSVGLTTFNTNHEKFTRVGVCISSLAIESYLHCCVKRP